MPGQHVGVGIARRQPRGDVEALGRPEILLHTRKIGADPHAGDDAARILAEGPSSAHPLDTNAGSLNAG